MTANLNDLYEGIKEVAELMDDPTMVGAAEQVKALADAKTQYPEWAQGIVHIARSIGKDVVNDVAAIARANGEEVDVSADQVNTGLDKNTARDTPHGLKPNGFLGHARRNRPRWLPTGLSSPVQNINCSVDIPIQGHPARTFDPSIGQR